MCKKCTAFVIDFAASHGTHQRDPRVLAGTGHHLRSRLETQYPPVRSNDRLKFKLRQYPSARSIAFLLGPVVGCAHAEERLRNSLRAVLHVA